MKVLLCTITVGEGVNKICNAVGEKLKEKNIEYEIYNPFENNRKKTKFLTQTYYRVAKIIPDILTFVQHKFSNYNRKLRKSNKYTIVKSDVNYLFHVLQEKVKSGNFDVIYTPVQWIALAAVLLKRSGAINCKVVYNIPDFNLPVYTELCYDCDLIISPCSEITNNLINNAQFSGDNVKQIPFPISDENFQIIDRETIRFKLNIPLDKFVVLIMGGGAGVGSIVRAIKHFQNDNNELYYIVVNGRNEKQKLKIDKWIQKCNWNNIMNLGFCKNVPELMSASDCLYSKVGAATMCEAYSKNLPFVTTKQKLYPEYDNLEHLIKYGAAKKCRNFHECSEIFKQLQADPKSLNEIKENFSKLFDRDSAVRIVDEIINLNN